MSSDDRSRPSRHEAAIVLLLMVGMTAWYAWPQAYYSLRPVLDTIRFLFR